MTGFQTLLLHQDQTKKGMRASYAKGPIEQVLEYVVEVPLRQLTHHIVLWLPSDQQPESYTKTYT